MLKGFKEVLTQAQSKSVLEQEVSDLVKRTDLEEETVIEVVNILKSEFED